MVGNFSQSTNRTFAGAIDEFQLYNASLTANQILANYQAVIGSLTSIGGAQSGPGGVLTNDSDLEGNPLSVTLGTGPSHQHSFALNANGSFTYIPTANYNGTDSFTYTVSDGFSSSGPITVSLTITAVNDAPIITSGDAASNAPITLAENTTTVTTVTATDPDLPSQTLTYSLTGGTDQGRFVIGASSGALTFLVGPNFEAPSDSDGNNTYQVIVTVSDGQGGLDTQTILVSIQDANEFATSAVSDTNSASNSVNENSVTGTVVGITARATDSDATNNLITYSLTNNAGGRFAIGTTTGVVTVSNGTLLNRESASSHTITVRASSIDGSFTDQNFTIAVGDIDEFDIGVISDTNIATNSVNENAANGTLVGITASASDADATNNTINYSLTQTAGGRFRINSTTGVVTVNDGTLLDRESTSSHLITILASSSDGSATSQNFTIAVNDVDEFDVGTISDSNSTVNRISENAANGTFVGITAVASDADATNSTITYALSNNAGGRYAINAATGVVSVNNGLLIDREASASHSIVIRSTSSDGSFSQQTFTIIVDDVDEFDVGTVTDSQPIANTVNENAANGTLVGIAALATDADATNNTITYSLVDSAGGRFAINSTSGFVSVADGTLLDFEVNSSHEILVQATSSGGSTNTTRFTIVVNNANESLPVFVSSDQATIAENQTFVQQLWATDADLPAQTLSYSVVGGADAVRFTISATNELIFVSAPDFENPVDANADNNYQVLVAVDDGNGGTTVQAVQVQVANSNEIPQVANQNFVVLQGETYQSTGRGVLTGASDVDGDTLDVTLFSTPLHGTLTLNPDGSFVYTPDSTFSGIDTFTFQVSDGNGGISQGTVSFLVSPSIPVIPTQQDLSTEPSQERTTSEASSTASKGSQASSEANKADSTSSDAAPPPFAIFSNGSNDSSQGTTASSESDRLNFSTTSVAREEGGRFANQNMRIASLTSSTESTSVHRILRGLQLQTNIKVSAQDLTDPASLGTTEYTVIQTLMWDDLDRMREQIRNESSAQPLVLGTAAGVASSLSVGYVMWLLRGGYVVAGFMAQLPAWRLIDPLPVLAQMEALGDDDDDDSLQSMVDRSNIHHENNSNLQNESKLVEVDLESNAIEVIGSHIT